ncbi:MAG: hypothetical protein ACE5K1_10450 [Acidiferrobacterales bacterium]
MSPSKPGDRELEQYLQERSTLSRVYKEAAHERPSASMDETVLARARHEVEHSPPVARSPFARNWMIPASLAAVIVLTVGLVTFLFEEGGVPLDAEAPKPARDSALEEVPTQRRDQAIPQTKQAPAKRERDHAEPEGVAPAVPAAAGRMVVPAEQKAEPSQSLKARKASKVKQETREQDESQLKKENSLDTINSPASGFIATETDALPPDEWLKQILELRRQGEHAAADANLAAFKKRYPDFPVEKYLE